MSTISIGNSTANAYAHTADTTGNLAFVAATNLANVATSGGIIVPLGTTAQRPASPVNGMVRYNINNNALEGYANNSWIGFV